MYRFAGRPLHSTLGMASPPRHLEASRTLHKRRAASGRSERLPFFAPMRETVIPNAARSIADARAPSSRST